MKKFFVVALGVVLGFALVGSAYAIDRASLESQTTEGLYDRNDPFDHALDPALLYQLDRWRLYTNLSGYDSEGSQDEGSYLIGTSGKLGPGSLALFYETNKFDRDEKWLFSQETLFYEEQSYHDPLLYPRYDRVWDERSFDSDQISFKWEEEENNFHVAYGMDFDGFSLGVTYAPEFMTSEYSLGANADWLPFEDSLPTNLPNSQWTGLFSEDWFQRMYQTTCFEPPCDSWNQEGWIASLQPSDPWDVCYWWDDGGSNTSWNFAQDGEEWMYFDRPEHVDYIFSNSSFSFHGKREIDRDVHPIEVGSHIHMADGWDLLVRAGYASINEDSDVTARYAGTLEMGEHHVDPVSGDTFDNSRTFDFTMNVDGALADDYDGDRWSIFLSPTYVVNDMVSVRLDLGYSTENGDTKGGVVGILNGSIEDRHTAQFVDPLATDIDEWHRWNVYESYDLSAKGDRDEDHWSVQPRVYLTFDKVNFALGAGYEYIDQDWKCKARRDKQVQYTYNDSIDDVPWLAGDLFPAGSGNTWTLVGSWEGEERYKGDAQVDIWTFPVATEFMVTDRLTLRAGASYTREYVESKQEVAVGSKENEQWTVYSGAEPVAGNERIVGPAENYQSDTDVVGEPFDDIDSTWGTTNKVEETYDYTTYNLGLGYAFTENLQMDLMWAGKGENGGVDMTEVFASVTLAF